MRCTTFPSSRSLITQLKAMDKFLSKFEPHKPQEKSPHLSASTSKTPEDLITDSATVDSSSNSSDIDNEQDETVVCLQDSDNSDSEPEDEEPIVKRKKYKIKYREQWRETFKNWLTEKNGNPFCKACCKSFQGGKRHLQRHADTLLHKKKFKMSRQNYKIDNILVQSAEDVKIDKQVRQGEFKLAMIAVEHNLPFLLYEHLPKAILSICSDSIIFKRITCSRTKLTGLINMKLGPYSRFQITNVLKITKFSIIVDETTDISTSKCLVIIVRYYDDIEEKVTDKMYGLIELHEATGEAIYLSIINLFKENNVPIINIVGFAFDNASAMMGNIQGVKARLKSVLPNIFVMRCTCHSIHLCASEACKKLPGHIEALARSIYAYFAHSSKRQKDLEQFQEFVLGEPHKILRPCQTRWLSLQSVIERICEQWQALVLYFRMESAHGSVGAEDILNGLSNIVYKLYFKFLSHILSIISKMNIIFQSEKSRIHRFLDIISGYYKTILKFYMKPDLFERKPIHLINPRNIDHFLPLNQMYFGAGFEHLLMTSHHQPSESDVTRLKTTCLEFYITFCEQLRSRIDFNDGMLKSLSATFDVKKLFTNDKPSIVQLASYFPHIIEENELDALNLEWRSLSSLNVDKISELEDLIVLFKTKNLIDEIAFPLLTKLLKIILALPHSSAAAERLFSKLSLLKSKQRNSLHVKTCENILLSKELLGGKHCFEWEPTTNLLNF